MIQQAYRLIALCVLCCVSSPLTSLARSPYYDQMRDGLKAYSEDQLDEAARLFETSSQIATNNHSDAALAAYNLGNVNMRQGEYEKAAAQFAAALNHEDEMVRADAYYNRGLSLYEQSKASDTQQDLDQAIIQITGALEMFENSLELESTSADVKANLELAYDYRELLLKKKQEQEQEQDEEQQEEESQEEDQQEDEQDQNEDQQDPDQEQNEDQQQNQDNPGQDQGDQPQSNKDDQQQTEDEQQQEAGDENEESENSNDPQNSAQDDAPAEDQPQNSTENPQQAQQMTREEALMLLDAMREQEANERSKFKIQYGSPNRNPIAKPY